MNMTCNVQPFKISASSMVFGPDLLEIISHLVELVDNIEIVLFHTPKLNNIPDIKTITKIISASHCCRPPCCGNGCAV